MRKPKGSEVDAYRYELVACGNQLERRRHAAAVPRGNEVLLRVLAAGLCHTDLHLSDGYFNLGGGNRISLIERGINLPHTLGHETVGEIMAMGPDVSGLSIGDRMLVYPWAGCDACELCTSEQGHLCHSPRFTGVFRPGGFGSHIVVSHPKYLFSLGGCLSWPPRRWHVQD
ncbi:alcohol dehydrogenase catalytic domain-containing protein [Pollutimonas thiosulfatoxidans]|uniref:Alcohol dehydrogenase-like N-terminal domain-containing protein n=1 Tax=Pollutimonas thiosulfatoxidans TaxID=2028345 RepID=A0A410G8N2_9BURK|nr:alcohol dehydrogenase catalytic domain-containing protein [Pollutimonas thiosulfatoxidans]QAA92647.1 hypothetical protein CKA81_01400 [Pollutimonas thiosulfatoxidans]